MSTYTLKLDRDRLRARLEALVRDWPEFDDDDAEINGGDLVEWMGDYREGVKKLLEEIPL